MARRILKVSYLAPGAKIRHESAEHLNGRFLLAWVGNIIEFGADKALEAPEASSGGLLYRLCWRKTGEELRRFDGERIYMAFLTGRAGLDEIQALVCVCVVGDSACSPECMNGIDKSAWRRAVRC